MKLDSREFRELIFDLVCGNLNVDENSVPESALVKNEFEYGGKCDLAYDRILDAYSRLCARLGVEEWADSDIEIIIDELMSIGKHTALKMFEYGLYFGRRERA